MPEETKPTNEEATTATPGSEPATETTTTEPTSTEADTATDTTEPTTPTRGKKLYISIAVAAFVIAFAYLALFTDSGRSLTPLTNGAVVATVDDIKITRTDFANSITSITETLKLQGVDIEDPTVQSQIEDEAIKRLINSKLLHTAAVEAGYTVDPESIDEELANLETSFGGAEGLAARLDELEISQEDLRKDVAEQIMVANYLEGETELAALTVTEEEVTNFYANAETQMGEELPPLEEVRADIEQNIMNQKQQAMLSELVAKLRAEADVEVLL